MVLEYRKDNRFKALASILEDYALWFCQISTVVAYRDVISGGKREVLEPSSFNAWLEEVEEKRYFEPAILEPIINIHTEMLEKGENLLRTVSSKIRPEQTDFEDFQTVYTGFITRIHRLERDGQHEDSGIDSTTGLRNFASAPRDLKREMERLSRQKVPFALVMSRIDGFDVKDQSFCLDVAVESMKTCMRTFDDAYYCDNGYFLLSLKHADIGGAQSAANRLKQLLDELSVEQPFTMSHCITEPVVGDDIPELLANMRADLEAYDEEENTILRFIEVSPLERFMNTKEN